MAVTVGMIMMIMMMVMMTMPIIILQRKHLWANDEKKLDPVICGRFALQ
jgi:hypothetical protein